MRLNKNRIVIISPNDGSDVRIGKVCRSLSAKDYGVHFIGWDRRPNVKKSIELGAVTKHIINIETHHGKFNEYLLIKFIIHIFSNLKKLKPNTVCCVDEEYALIAFLCGRFNYRYLICDVFDSLYDRHSNKNYLSRSLLMGIQYISRYLSDLLIATDEERYSKFGHFKSKCIVIPNYPEDPGEELSKRTIEGPLKIYVSGTLIKTRGLDTLIKAILHYQDIEILSAGWVYDDYASEVFMKNQNVKYFGIITAKQSLEIASQCDGIFAYYEPISINNIQASPNKIYDAMSVGRPVIINNEVIVSKWVTDEKIGYSAPYYDVNALVHIFDMLKHQRNQLKSYALNSRKIFSKGYSWESVSNRLLNIYETYRRD